MQIRVIGRRTYSPYCAPKYKIKELANILVECKSCGKEIGQGENKCAHCGVVQRAWLKNSIIISGIVAFSLLGGFVSAMNKGTESELPKVPGEQVDKADAANDKPNVVTVDASTVELHEAGVVVSTVGAYNAPVPKQPATAPADGYDPVKLSKEGSYNGANIVVTGFKIRGSVGDTELGVVEAQGEFKTVSLSITNNQTDTISVEPSDYKLVDNTGREFGYSLDAQKHTKQVNSLTEKIATGATVSGEITFDVDKDAKGFKLKISGEPTGRTIVLNVE